MHHDMHDGRTVFCSIDGYDSHDRKRWPNYRRSAFTLACAFDRCKIVRALVVELHCELDIRTNYEDGIVLIDENGHEREWIMTGFDLAIEFGSLDTLALLCELEKEHPGCAAAVHYAGRSHDECRTLCLRNVGNRPRSDFDPAEVISAIRLWTDDSEAHCTLKCGFCMGK